MRVLEVGRKAVLFFCGGGHDDDGGGGGVGGCRFPSAGCIVRGGGG